MTERLFSRSAGSLSPLPGVARVAFLRADVFSSEAAATLGGGWGDEEDGAGADLAPQQVDAELLLVESEAAERCRDQPA